MTSQNLNSFSVLFMACRNFLQTFTFCGELLRISRTAPRPVGLAAKMLGASIFDVTAFPSHLGIPLTRGLSLVHLTGPGAVCVLMQGSFTLTALKQHS